MSPIDGKQRASDRDVDATRSFPDSPANDDPRLLAAVQEYTAALEAGRRPNRLEFISRHPEIAQELAACLDGLAFVHSAAAQVQGEVGAAAHNAAGDEPFTGRPLGDFRLVREIGRGGMGVVYEAVQLSLGRRVAVKVLPLAAAFDPKHLQRFRNEAQAAAQLHHTNIVPVYAVGCERGVHYYAMQLIQGQSLTDVIGQLRGKMGRAADPGAAGSRDATATMVRPVESPDENGEERNSDNFGPLTSGVRLRDSTHAAQNLTTLRSSKRSAYFRAVARLGLQAAEALEYAHQMGVVHRDIKPANLLLDVRGNLWITDFGLAQLYAESGLTQTGDLLGTLRYMSPEQASGRAVVLDQRTDIYSLGVTLYEMLTLERALPGQTRQQLLYEVGSVDPKSPRSIDKSIPPELEIILSKAISKEASDRYPTARALADDLQRFLRDEPILARPPSIWDKAIKWTRRHKPVAVSVVVVLVLAALGLLTSTLLIAHQQALTKAAYQRERERAIEANAQRARFERSFNQARDAVDFFTRVAADEMANNPQFTDVRREMLQQALVYYQSFLDERKDDPSIGAELAAARSKVSAILTELSAFDEFIWANLRSALLWQPSIAGELQLSPEQAEHVEQLNAGFPRRLMGLGELRKLTSEQKQQRLKQMAGEIETKLNAILTPKQSERLRQIGLQAAGPLAFSQPAVADALSLTRDQKEKIRAIQAEYDDKHHRRIGFIHTGPPPGEPPDRGAEGSSPSHEHPPKPPDHFFQPDSGQQRQDAMNRILVLLTPSQVQIWKGMTGEPYNGPMMLEFHFGPPPDHPENHD